MVRKVYLIGIGLGNPDTLTVGAGKAIARSGLVIGAKRIVESVDIAEGAQVLTLIKPSEIAAALRDGDAEEASVLFSGDIGFYSGATGLYKYLDELEGLEVKSIPGISSLVYFCAALHTPWQDAFLASAHGRSCNAVAAVQTHAKTFLLTGGATKAHDVCAQLVEAGMETVRVAAGERLSYEDERIVRGTAAELAKVEFADLTVLLCENDAPITRATAAPALPDDAFIRTGAPMTKEEVRELCISKLRLRSDSALWDVGAGTGSVSVEGAFAACAGEVWAIEKDADALESLEANKQRFGLNNLHIVDGFAPEALVGLPAPDAVFVGGSTGQLKAIVNCALEETPAVRVVATGITLETIAELVECAGQLPLFNVEVVSLTVARSRELGAYHLMMGQNPIYILSATGPDVSAAQAADPYGVLPEEEDGR